jgi:hypothetical protein
MPAQTAVRQVATMAKKKGVRIIVTLECTEAKTAGATPSRYCTQKVRPGRSMQAERRAGAAAAAADALDARANRRTAGTPPSGWS